MNYHWPSIPLSSNYSKQFQSDDIHQEALIACEADCDDEESSLGFAHTKIPVNADLLEFGDPSINKVRGLVMGLKFN